ncbi:hypothetical protein [Nostoc phage Nsp-JY21]
MTVLLQDVARDREALRARELMIDILGETVTRLRGAGFAPALELADGEALVVLRLDVSAWAVQQVGLPVRVLEAEPKPGTQSVPRVDMAALPGPAVKECLAVPKPASAPRKAAVPAADSFWTAERDAQLIALRRDGQKASVIAVLMGLKAVQAVHDRIYRLKKNGVAVPDKVKRTSKPFGPAHVTADGIAKREWQAEEDAALIAAHADFSQDLGDVAKAMGRTRTSLGKRIAYLRGKGRITAHRPRSTFPQAAPAPKDAVAVVAPAASVVERKSEPVSAVPDAPKPAPPAAPVVIENYAPMGKTTDAARFVPRAGGGTVPGAARPVQIQRPPEAAPPVVQQGASAGIVARHLDALPGAKGFDAELDLELCEAVFGGTGGLQLFATGMGFDLRAVQARFEAIVAPFRRPGVKALPIETAGLLLPALRARVAQARGAA